MWDRFLSKFTPPRFLDELAGMRAWHTANPRVPLNITTDVASIRFSTLANLPADTVNIISMLEQELERALGQELAEHRLFYGLLVLCVLQYTHHHDYIHLILDYLILKYSQLLFQFWYFFSILPEVFLVILQSP